MTAMVLSTLEAVRNATAPADYYRISMELQRFATPADFAALVANKTIARGEFRDWLLKFHDFILARRKEPVQSEHKRFSNNIYLFHQRRLQKRVLAVGFSGAGGILLVPTAVWLQYLLSEVDVLVLDDPAHKGFTTGILNHSGTFDEMLSRLQSDLDIGSYDEVRCFGTSGGGGASLAAGIIMNATTYVSFSGRRPTFSSSYGRTQPAIDMEKILRTSNGPGGNAFAVYGADHIKDRTNAKQLAGLMEITRLPIPDVNHHNVVTKLHTRGILEDLLRQTGLLTAAET